MMSIAYWCILVAAVLPYATLGLAKAQSGYDNSNPRKPDSYTGAGLRANHAHQNGLEVFAFFAVAVLVASAGSAKVTIPPLDALAAIWVVLRIVYTGVYLGNLASARSLVWIAGFFVAVAIFTMPVWHE